MMVLVLQKKGKWRKVGPFFFSGARALRDFWLTITPPFQYIDSLTSLFNLLLIFAGILEYILLGVDYTNNFANVYVRFESPLFLWNSPILTFLTPARCAMNYRLVRSSSPSRSSTRVSNTTSWSSQAHSFLPLPTDPASRQNREIRSHPRLLPRPHPPRLHRRARWSTHIHSRCQPRPG